MDWKKQNDELKRCQYLNKTLQIQINFTSHMNLVPWRIQNRWHPSESRLPVVICTHKKAFQVYYHATINITLTWRWLNVHYDGLPFSSKVSEFVFLHTNLYTAQIWSETSRRLGGRNRNAFNKLKTCGRKSKGRGQRSKAGGSSEMDGEVSFCRLHFFFFFYIYVRKWVKTIAPLWSPWLHPFM